MMKDKNKKLRIACCIFFGAASIMLLCNVEMYCYFSPSIDTNFANGYTEARFDMVMRAMPNDEVKQLIGDPLNVVHNKDGSETWWYSEDGKCKFGDFAWLGRSITFEKGSSPLLTCFSRNDNLFTLCPYQFD